MINFSFFSVEDSTRIYLLLDFFYQNYATDGKSRRMYIVHLYMKVENKMMAETKTICHTLLFDSFVHDELEPIVFCLSLSYSDRYLFMISVERACRRSSLLAGVHHRAPFPIGELPGSLLVSGWLE